MNWNDPNQIETFTKLVDRIKREVSLAELSGKLREDFLTVLQKVFYSLANFLLAHGIDIFNVYTKRQTEQALEKRQKLAAGKELPKKEKCRIGEKSYVHKSSMKKHMTVKHSGAPIDE